jgi:GNAT superfamily N-acetyltransferase
LSDFYDLRRSTIVDTAAAIGFAGGLIAAMALRWSILNVNFRYGNFARAVYDFSKTMLGWGLVGGALGLGVGLIVARSWQHFHMQVRQRREVAAAAQAAPRTGLDHPERISLARPAATIADNASNSSIVSPGPVATTRSASNIRYDQAGLNAEAFVALSRRVWPRNYDVGRATQAIEKTLNVGAWDGPRLVGAVRVLSDGYFFATIPEILVDPEYRKRGIGRELIGRALALSPSGTLLIGATSDSVGFFQRIGCELAPMGFVLRRS